FSKPMLISARLRNSWDISPKLPSRKGLPNLWLGTKSIGCKVFTDCQVGVRIVSYYGMVTPVVIDPRCEKFIRSCPHELRMKILRYEDLLREYGKHVGFPYSRKITQDIYELR